MKSIKFTSSKHFFFIGYIIFIIILPILAYFLYPIINTQGVSLLIAFLIIFIISTISHLRASKIYCEINTNGIIISDGIKIIRFQLSEIREVNTQALVSKRMGVYKICPYLVFKVSNERKKELHTLSSSRGHGFLQISEDLSNYRSEDKGDLYLSIENLKKVTLLELKDIFNKPLTPLKPLIKTQSKEEYDKIIKDYFKK